MVNLTNPILREMSELKRVQMMSLYLYKGFPGGSAEVQDQAKLIFCN